MIPTSDIDFYEFYSSFDQVNTDAPGLGYLPG